MIRKSETDYYQEQITCHNNSCNLMWKLFGKMLKNKQNAVHINKLKYQDKTLTKPFDISETFNNYFTNIGKNLANKFEEQNHNNLSHDRFLNIPYVNPIQLPYVTSEEIINIIDSLETKKK